MKIEDSKKKKRFAIGGLNEKELLQTLDTETPMMKKKKSS